METFVSPSRVLQFSYSIEKEKLNSSKIKIIKEEERQRIKKNYN